MTSSHLELTFGEMYLVMMEAFIKSVFVVIGKAKK